MSVVEDRDENKPVRVPGLVGQRTRRGDSSCQGSKGCSYKTKGRRLQDGGTLSTGRPPCLSEEGEGEGAKQKEQREGRREWRG